ncbi:MAG: S26 family signal peptidase [Methanomicrobiales archaeon]|nr:S26 family signal peptidase [Methanomicrobiales archaeon]MDI6876646.1 S26 family signal peptidase [Methanomicrobiales archaeon]
MADAKKLNGSANPIRRFRESDNPWVSLARDLLWVAAVVGGFALVLFLAAGTWPALVTIESESMVPHMNVGDLVFVVEEDRFGPLRTWEEGRESGYAAFGDYGDVIVYRPNGENRVNPIIHRAMAYSDADAGYITKGDNNQLADQQGYYQGIGAIEPVRKEWIVGKALFAIPLLGYPALHLFEFAAIVIVLMLLYEVIAGRKEESGAAKRGKR